MVESLVLPRPTRAPSFLKSTRILKGPTRGWREQREDLKVRTPAAPPLSLVPVLPPAFCGRACARASSTPRSASADAGGFVSEKKRGDRNEKSRQVSALFARSAERGGRYAFPNPELAGTRRMAAAFQLCKSCSFAGTGRRAVQHPVLLGRRTTWASGTGRDGKVCAQSGGRRRPRKMKRDAPPQPSTSCF